MGTPREVTWRGRTVRTSIWKGAVAGRVRTAGDHLAGDGQADRSVHGGHDKAVYAYPSEHYPCWQRELGGGALPHGVFGENLTTAGLVEQDLRPGDRLRIGSTVLTVTQPRLPCYKLGIRFGRPDMVKRFHASRRSGFYLSITTAGELGAGDAIVVESVDR
ncbi:MAG: MOSC domain-containing protein, partial [Candidatus Eiseniibacteriota bacterium]